MKTLVLSLLVLVSLFGVRGSPRLLTFYTQTIREPPPPVQAKDAVPTAVTTQWVEQPLDHFNDDGNQPTWRMRYMANDQFFVKDGPILIMLGGEWTISSNFLTGGHMFSIGRSLGAYLMYTEHRYYGESHPTTDTASENLKYLYVDQALADVAKLVRELKATSKFANSPVVVFGGSYAGNMATWARLEYPDVIDAAVASSGPVFAKADFYEYLETVNDALASEGTQACVDVIAQAIKNIEELLKTPNGVKEVSTLFKTCNPINIENPLDVQSFYSTITESFSGLIQYSTIATIQRACTPLLDNSLGSPQARVAKYVTKDLGTNDCSEIGYQKVVEQFRNTSYADDIATIRLWIYQTCTEYGYYQTTNSKNQPFGDNLPLSFFQDNFCKDVYGDQFGAETIANGINHVNTKYGALEPNATKVVSIHGSLDPWHRLGITEDLSEDLPAQLVIGSSHCKDLQAPASSDPAGLIEARAKVAALVTKWVREARK